MKYLILIIIASSVQAQVLVDQYRFTVGAPVTGNNLLTDLAAAWTFDEVSGNPQDASGNGRHLTHYGTVESSGGILANSRLHDSTENDDYFDVASDTWNTFAGNDFTIAYWFKPDATTGIPQDQMHVAKADDGGGGTSWIIEIDNGGYTFNNAMIFYGSLDGLIPGAPLLTVEFPEVIAGNTVWYCVVIKREGDDYSMFLGKAGVGAFIGSATATQSGDLFDNNTVPVTVGVYLSGGAVVPTHDVQGEIDELFIWNRALSECEIAKWFNASSALSFTSFDGNPCL